MSDKVAKSKGNTGRRHNKSHGHSAAIGPAGKGGWTNDGRSRIGYGNGGHVAAGTMFANQ